MSLSAAVFSLVCVAVYVTVVHRDTNSWISLRP